MTEHDIERGLADGNLKPSAYGWPQCVHTQRETRRRITSNNAVLVVNQCLWCGHSVQINSFGVNRDVLPAWHATRFSEFSEAVTSWARRREQTRRTEDEVALRAHYDAYLASPDWRSKRALVMKRAAALCEACLSARATEVHHTTYAHFGNEPLWELRAVCRPCHERITELDRNR